MPRFWLYSLAACLCAGCAGRSVEGIWEGPLPPIAGSTPCRIRLLNSNLFDYSCKGAVLREGAGRYQLDGEILRITFLHFSENGRPAKLDIAPFSAKVIGPGNEMHLTPFDAGGSTVIWQRSPL